MIQSMTAFATRSGQLDAQSWVWDLRGVNGRGLDLRLRLPDGLDGLEAGVRTALTAALSRGNVTVSLRLSREDQGVALSLDMAQLDRVLTAFETVQERAFALGVTLGQPTAADVLAQRGVMIQQQGNDDTTELVAALLQDFSAALAEFTAMRASEGAALQRIVADQLATIGTLTEKAASAAETRRDDVRAAMTAALSRVMDTHAEVDADRVAQELALIAVKSDITEEIDRLRTHVTAAQALLIDPKPVGRKLDFLSQEFNREANTLCSKAGSPALTAIGLDLKAVIDQMREQIQNVE